MKIIKPSAEIIAFSPFMIENIEKAGRTCYKSEERATGPKTTAKLINHLKSLNHESVLEHGSITVRFIVDRGVSHELVRHRLASFSQESTRYCNYSKEKFGNEVTFIDPGFERWDELLMEFWSSACENAENAYFALLNNGATPQEARSVLPNSLKTEVVMTANPREWRHVFKQRTSPAAHPQMREVMIPLLDKFCEQWPLLFEDVKWVQHQKEVTTNG